MVPGLQVATSPLRMCRSVPQMVVLVRRTMASDCAASVGLGRSSSPTWPAAAAVDDDGDDDDNNDALPRLNRWLRVWEAGVRRAGLRNVPMDRIAVVRRVFMVPPNRTGLPPARGWVYKYTAACLALRAGKRGSRVRRCGSERGRRLGGGVTSSENSGPERRGRKAKKYDDGGLIPHGIWVLTLRTFVQYTCLSGRTTVMRLAPSCRWRVGRRSRHEAGP
ncbi:hypothetical protein VTK73DRAFT_4553 [Phialemonium thermophilum]|uniref:Uncharacterized protein n=1 Tax=Phialemonium thermophilum TaxID=223376 RepID=A0ABR3V7N1_9PEZI